MSDDGKHGLTIIAFVGSVFSPYYAWTRRHGDADPHNHCAVNVALYGETKRWSMTERPRCSLAREEDSISIGPSSMFWNGSSLEIAINEIAVPFPSRIRGTVRVFPAAITPDVFTLNSEGNHIWWPIAPRCRIEVSLDKPALSWAGEGYFDTNSGDAPLEDGFREWDWSRAPMNDSTAILYEAEKRGGGRTDIALICERSGEFRMFEPPAIAKLPKTRWRISRQTRSEGHAKVIRTFEDAPFYARSVVSAQFLGKPVKMVHESLSLDRFRMSAVQAMLPFRMPRAWK